MSNTLVARYITRLPEQKISELTQLQWSVQQTAKNYAEVACNTIAAWKLFDTAVEIGASAQVKNDYADLAAHCEHIEKLAYAEWDEAKRRLLAYYQ